ASASATAARIASAPSAAGSRSTSGSARRSGRVRSGATMNSAPPMAQGQRSPGPSPRPSPGAPAAAGQKKKGRQGKGYDEQVQMLAPDTSGGPGGEGAPDGGPKDEPSDAMTAKVVESGVLEEQKAVTTERSTPLTQDPKKAGKSTKGTRDYTIYTP